ncbi:hypothetical protein AQUSIP_22690 [Aquicella siphonis]|uniref:Outer membrane protein TolC n=2 Tax=Aquicella siphonis TaxID=254247 RepID=A0A5E4PL08_9COXI|nr:hypothetical protein AQUSIP_22690 [Aquicella siphonis]
MVFVWLWSIANAIAAYPEQDSKNKGMPQLSLDDAILLAVRSNPNVQSSRLSYVAQKFSLWVQEWQFYPHYSFQASAAFSNNRISGQSSSGSHNYDVQPAVSLVTPIGTTLTLSASNPDINHYNPGISLQIMQPLIRGFGKAVVEASLNDARDSTVISRLNIEGVLRSTVTDVINAYLGVVSAEQTVVIDEDAVKRAEKSVEQTRLFIKAGHKAGNELVTVEANVASAKTQLENDKNSLAQARYALLTAIGLDPNADIRFSSLDVQSLIRKYHLPALAEAKKLTLENDIQYQTEEITLHGQKSRNLMVAEDNTRWKLDFTANVATGSGSGGGLNAGINSVFNGANQAQSVGLTLQIPIDDQQSKQAVVNAKIALKQAELALLQDKWNKETGAINSWNTVVSAERALRFAVDAQTLQEKTYQVSYQKYLHGLIDSLELQSAQLSLIQAQQASLNARINYLRALVNLDLIIGNTLRTWKINVRL